MKKSFVALIGSSLLMMAALQAQAADALQHISPSPAFPYSKAVKAGDAVYVSGQLGTGADGKLVQGFEAQAHQVMRNVGAVLKEAGLGMDDVAKCTVFINDMNNFPAFNEVYKTYFKAGKYPARSAMGVNGLALKADLEVECIAYQPAH